MAKVKSFLGSGWSFPPRFDRQLNTVHLVSDEEDIRQSLFILLSTRPGERITNLSYGCDLHSVLFQPMTNAIRFLIREVIQTAVLFYEPRIDLDEIDIDLSDDKEGIVRIQLHYTVRATNARNNIVFPFYKIEGTNITSDIE
jgi:phage baseplate assembly protein W